MNDINDYGSEAVIFIGIQAAGKSTFYLKNTQQSFVADNINPAGGE